jgi:cyclin-dependent kinase-like
MMKLYRVLFWPIENILKDNKNIVAIKKFKENSKSFVKRELKMLNLLKSCEFVVTLKEAYRRKEKIYFIFDYVDKVIF